MTPAIAVTNLVKRFGALTAVDHVTFNINGGETVVLWGPNGAGKTTVLRCILGIIPFEGTVEVFGLDVQVHGKHVRRQIGYVPQELGLPDESSVWETVSFYARLRRVPEAQAEALLRVWQLHDVRQKLVRSLSGGMKQKLALVIALLSDPPIMLLDEPTSNLDVRSRRDFYALLERLKASGKTLLLCSHRASEVWRLADRVVVIERGRMIVDGPPEQARSYFSEALILSLTLPLGQAVRAAICLEAHGFSVHHNGAQLWVKVPLGRKAEPLACLSNEKIPVLDFELDSIP